MRQKIQIAVDEAVKNGTRKLRIMYKRDAVQGLYALMALVNAGMLAMSLGDSTIALAVIESRDWEHDENRSFTVLLTEKFEAETFIAPIALYLEKVAYARPKQPA